MDGLAKGAPAMTADPQTEMLLTVEDLADLLSLSRRTVWRWLNDGRLPVPLRLSPRVVRWRASDVQQFLDRKGDRISGSLCSAKQLLTRSRPGPPPATAVDAKASITICRK
jgi:prophage regulatory protein